MSRSRAAVGLGCVLVGAVFLLDALAVIDLWAAGEGWWPSLLVIVGLVLMLRRSEPGRPRRRSVGALLAARSAEPHARPYRGGRVSAVLGHAQLDLRNCTLPNAGATVKAYGLLGHVAVTVPPGWRVESATRLLLADLDTDLLPTVEDAPVLTVAGVLALSDLHVRTGSVVA